MRSALLLLIVVLGMVGCKNTESQKELENTTETENPIIVQKDIQKEQNLKFSIDHSG